METFYNEQDLDFEYIASQLGISYDKLIELAQDKGLTPYELVEEFD